MGQIRSAADYILLRPEGFEEALMRLAGRAGEAAVNTYLENLKEDKQGSSVQDMETDVGTVRLFTKDHIEDKKDDIQDREDDIAAVRFFVEQNLNQIHITLRDGWRRQVRTLAVLVAGAAGFLTICFADVGPLAKGTVVLIALVWGGFFSWLARDLVALVERRRG